MSRRGVIALYAALIALFVVATLGREPYDDAYFFKRVALNLLDRGSLSWNPSDGPVYGITSQLFLALCVALTALARDYTLLVTRLVLAACLVGAFALSYVLTEKRDRGVSAALAFCSPVALFTITSGMETAFCLLLVSVGLWLLYTARQRHWLLAPLLTLALWLARPDAVLLLLVPLLAERARLRDLFVLGVSVVTLLGVFKLFYGTALPLPFYAKQRLLSGYDADFIASSNAAHALHAGLFAASALAMAAFSLLRRDRTNLALLGASLLFTLYHGLTTIDVMGMHARFYAPALPLLALAAARAAEVPHSQRTRLALLATCALTLAALGVAGLLPGPGLERDERVALPYYLLSALGSALLIMGGGRQGALALIGGGALAVAASHGLPRPALASDETYLLSHQRRVTVFRGLETLRGCFGDALSVMHSEVGVPGLRFPRGKVFDLAGLFDRRWLLGERSFDSICRADSPEAIFMPHKNYVDLNRTVADSECLRDYVRVVQDSSSPLHVRADLLPRYERCAGGRAGR